MFGVPADLTLSNEENGIFSGKPRIISKRSSWSHLIWQQFNFLTWQIFHNFVLQGRHVIFCVFYYWVIVLNIFMMIITTTYHPVLTKAHSWFITQLKRLILLLNLKSIIKVYKRWDFLLMLCLLMTISGKVFIDILRINFLAIMLMKDWYSSTNLGIEVLGISHTYFLLLLLEAKEWFALRCLVKNYMSMMVRHLWSLSLQLWIYLIWAHSLRGMKLTFNLPAINWRILWARSHLVTFWRCLMGPYYLGFLILPIKSFVNILLILINSCIDDFCFI